MRGTGYAISEILIFLAIASIIGFLLGWLVFRRAAAPATTRLDTKELRDAETRVKALEASMAKTERRADAAVAAASKAATMAPAATVAATGAAGTAPSKERGRGSGKPDGQDAGKGEPERAKVDAGKASTEPVKAKIGKEGAEKVREPIKVDDKQAEPAKAEAGKKASPSAMSDSPGKKPPEDKPAAAQPKSGTGDEELDYYLSDADARIQKLEKTLERLRGKLDDLDE